MKQKIIAKASPFRIHRIVELKPDTIGFVIGKKRETLNFIEKLSGAKIILSGVIANIRGLSLEVKKAAGLLQLAALRLRIDCEYYERVDLSGGAIGRAIGTKQSNLRFIETLTGTEIHIRKQYAWILGPKNGVLEAVKQIKISAFDIPSRDNKLSMRKVTVSFGRRHLIYGKIQLIEAETQTRISGNKNKFRVQGKEENVNNTIDLIKLIAEGPQAGKEYVVELTPVMNGINHIEIVFANRDCFRVHLEHIRPRGIMEKLKPHQTARIKVLTAHRLDLSVEIITPEEPIIAAIIKENLRPRY